MAMSRLDGNDTAIEKPKGLSSFVLLSFLPPSKGEGEQRFHRLSTLRFIPEGDEVSRVLIHLPSLTFRRHGSRLGDRSITMTIMSVTECPPLLKCSATGDTSVLRCVMSDR